jgi:hypothetical protein
VRLLRRVLVLVGVAVLGVAAPAEAAPTGKLVFDVKIMAADITINERGTPDNQPDQGERVTGFGSVLKKGTNRKIGTAHFDQVVTQVVSEGSETQPPVLTSLAYGVYQLRGGKIFTMISLGADPRVTEVGAIIGGTGRYKDARGEFRDRILEFNENFQLSRQTLRFSSRRERPTTVARRAPAFPG